MKKLLAVIAIALVVAGAVWVALRVRQANRRATVAELLPQSTLILAQVPDFQRARKQWQASDLYQIWREPMVQTWLKSALARLPKNQGGRQALEKFLQLGPKEGFVALSSLEKNDPKLIGGFHFDSSSETARAFVEERKTEWRKKFSEAKTESLVYEQHQIETLTAGHVVFASVFDNHWFFVANDLAALKTLLDRVDRRPAKSGPSLATNAAFNDAIGHLPTESVGLLFVDPRPFVEKLMPVVALTGQSLPLDQLEQLKHVRAIATTLGFEHGKMRETDFVAMPRVSPDEKLERRSLGEAGANTFFYSATRFRWTENLLAPSPAGAVGLPTIWPQLRTALTTRGIEQNDLRAAFGDEIETRCDWPPDARWPFVQATLPVKDAARARKIAEALASVEVGGNPWTKSDKNGATIYTAPLFGGLVPVSVALAVSDQAIFVGSNAAAIEAAVTRGAPPDGALEKSEIFRDISKQVPAPTSAFDYVDARLLFERADAALRPLLLMSATLSPTLGRNIEAARLPPPEAIAKHLSPIVMSQRYEDDGYVTRSVGPVTFREATIGLVGGVAGLLIYLQEGLKGGGLLRAQPANPSAPPPSAPSPTPSASPI